MNALLLIDVQNDFLPGGALAVPQGDEIVPLANQLIARFDLVIASQDWHPADHGSFAVNHPGKNPGDRIELAGLPQILWPVHCVQQTAGADLAPALDKTRLTHVTRKGTDPHIDSYSAFFDNGHRHATDLDPFLRARNVTDLFILGLATDYCVKFTALDALRLGYRVTVIEDACRGVDLSPSDITQAIAEMQTAGAAIVQSATLMRSLDSSHGLR